MNRILEEWLDIFQPFSIFLKDDRNECRNLIEESIIQ